MELRPGFLLQTIVKAMSDVILPAVDPNNKLAQEQARLVIGMLNLVNSRLPLMYRYDRDELSRFLALASTLQSLAKDLPGAGEAVAALDSTLESGADVLRRAAAEPGELEVANFNLREKIGALITAVYSTTDFTKLEQIKAAITSHAREQLLRDRSWLISQGWEPDPAAIPDIETLIGESPRLR
jgi:hypothetical protein